MARKYRRRQVKIQETAITLGVLFLALTVASALVLPSSTAWMSLIVVILLIIAAAVVYYSIYYKKLKLQREGLRQLEIDDVDAMSGVAFETYVAELFRRQGYTIHTTATSGDYGVDLIMLKDGIRTAVQTKRYSKPVNQAAIREAVAGMKHYKCTESMVVTNSSFTRFATELAATNNCWLVDREGLIELIVTNKAR